MSRLGRSVLSGPVGPVFGFQKLVRKGIHTYAFKCLSDNGNEQKLTEGMLFVHFRFSKQMREQPAIFKREEEKKSLRTWDR